MRADVRPPGPIVRVEEAGLGPDHPVRLVVSRLADPERLQRAWSASGAVIECRHGRLRAVTSVRSLVRAAGRTLAADEAGRLERAVETAVRAWADHPPLWSVRDLRLRAHPRPLVMGVVNVTPDSFSDGGAVFPDDHPAAAVALGRRLHEEGADVLDVGGESTRPGAAPVDADEERARTEPVVAALAADGVVVSIDTTKPSVAEAALEAGAVIVNDVGLAGDPELLDVVARSGAGYVLMHSRARPADMQQHTDYVDVVADVFEALVDGLARCEAAGIDPARVAIDPGIGFAKTAEQSVAVLRGLRGFRSLGRPVLVGASRKTFLGHLLGEPDPAARLEGSLVCAAHATWHGGSVIRVHDVGATVRAVTVASALAGPAASAGLPPSEEAR